MNLRTNFIIYGITAVLLFHAGCQENPVEPVKTASISGNVSAKDGENTGQAISLAIVVDIGSKAALDTTDDKGNYVLQLGELKSQYTTNLVTSAAGYFTDTTDIIVGLDNPNPIGINIRLKRDTSVQIVTGRSGLASSILFVKATAKTIALKGTGQNEFSILTFRVVDSTGSPVVGTNRCVVKFSISASHFSGEYVSPTSAQTDPLTGEVATTVFSGTEPNVIQVIASTRGDTVKASPVFLTAGGGLPDGEHVSIAATKFNIAGRVYDNLTTTINVTVSDRFGNPVADGTQLSFRTNGGVIPSSSSTTDGMASVDLRSGGGDPPVGARGIVTVTAETKGDTSYRMSDSLIVDSVRIIFSGPTQPPTILDTAAQNFIVPDGGSREFGFIVSDDYGNPLVEGSTITVSVKASDSLQQDLELINNTKTYTKVDAQNIDTIKVLIRDKNKGGAWGDIKFGIEIKSVNNDYSNKNWFPGYVLGSEQGPIGTLGVPAEISLKDTLARQLYLNETQLPDTSTTITFIVKDAFGSPLNESRKAHVSFSLNKPPSGTYIFPGEDSTNASGAASVTVVAGNNPGITTVTASVTDGTRLISTESPLIDISHGLPDSTKIFLTLKNNMPNKRGTTPVGILTIDFSDIHGNSPAPQLLLFNTTIGRIGTSAKSNLNGNASVFLYGGSEGFGTASASILVHGGITVTRSVPFLLSGTPQITYSDTTIVDTKTNALQAPLADGSFVLINFRVWDINHYPISSGNAIKITLSGPATEDMELSGDIDIPTLLDTQDTTQTQYQFRIKDNNRGGGLSGEFTITINITGESGTVTKKLTGVLLPPVRTRATEVKFVSSSTSPVYVRSTGLPGTTTLTFALIDSFANPVTLEKGDTVLFSILNGTGQEWLSDIEEYSDANGQVTTTFHTSTKSGTFVVSAQVKNSAPVIKASTDVTVIGGFPNPNKFTMQWAVTPPDTLLNLPGLVVTGSLANVNILALDQYSNPAKPSVIQFDETSGGSVGAVTTDADGRASAALSGGKPYPNEVSLGGFGFGYLKARTLSENGVFLRDSLKFLFTGAPSITSSLDTIVLNDGDQKDLTYIVTDVYGKALAGGNNVAVTVEGYAAGGITLEGTTSVSTPVNKIIPTQYDLRVKDNEPNGGISGSFRIIISVNGPSGSATRTIVGVLRASEASSPTKIVLSEISDKIIAAYGTGGKSTADLTFLVMDAGGHPIDITQKDTVVFTLSDTSGGTYVIPTWAITDENGKASTRIYAGIKYGNPSVTATMNTGTSVITSSPEQIRISGPYSANFNVTLSQENLPGLSQIGKKVGTLSLQIGDSVGNPVLPGTIVTFATTGGMVDPSVTTAVDGSAIANLYGGAQPNDPTPGAGRVTARTQGNNGAILTKQVQFLFSGAPIITTLDLPSSDTITIFDGGYIDVNYKIADANRNPLAADNIVVVDKSGLAAGGLSLSIDYKFSTIDTKDTNATFFRVRISDAVTNGGASGAFDITISVSGPNGLATRQFHGILRSPSEIIPPSPTAKLPAQIAFLSVSASDIYVAGVGALENSVISYEVRDSLGVPIERNLRAYATFDLQFFPNTFTQTGTYPRLIPNADSTDDNGRLRVSVNSGTQAGVVQVVARIDMGSGKYITSQPVRISVHAGFPDQKHFTIAPQFFNHPGLDQAFVSELITVQVVDKYSNPVLPGTVVYFNTTHGAIGTGKSKFSIGYTDLDGFVIQTLWSGNPSPEGPDTLTGRGNGWTKVYARTIGADSARILDSIDVLWTGMPILTLTSGPTSFTVPNAGSDGPWTFTVVDRFGHPMSAGTSISVSCGDATIDGNANLTLGDYVSGGSGITDFSVVASDSDPIDGKPPKPADLLVRVSHPIYGTRVWKVASGSTD